MLGDRLSLASITAAAPALAAVACSPRTAPHINSRARRHLLQDLPRRPLAAPTDPWGLHDEWQAANSICSARACNHEAKDLVATTDAVLGHLQQPSQPHAEPSQDVCSCAEGGTQAALAADKAPKSLTPEAAEQGLLLSSAPLSTLPQPAQEAPAASSRLQDMLDLPLLPVVHTAGHNVPTQERSWPHNAFGALRSGAASAGAGQSGPEQQLGELPTHSPPPKLRLLPPRPQPRVRQAEASTGPPISCMPVAMPGDELCPEDECLVCFAAQRCVLLAPCGHMPCCVKCAEQLCGPKGTHAIDKGQLCPLCREAVLATVSKTFS